MIPRHSILRTLAVALVTCSAILPCSALAQAKRGAEDPILETKKIVEQVKHHVDKTTEGLDKLSERLSFVFDNVNLLDATELPEGVKVKILEKTAAAQRVVNDGVHEARQLQRCFGVVQDGLDLYAEMQGIVTTARSFDLDAGGNLATSLYTLSSLLDQYAGKVPLLGAALKSYGTIGKELVTVLARLRDNLNERRQAHVGLGIPPHSSRRNSVLWKQDQAAFKRHTYAPSGPAYAYRPIDLAAEQTMILLWDEAGDAWYIVNRRVNAEQVYGDNLRIGRSLTPAAFWKFLRYPNYENLQRQREVGGRIADYFQGVSNVAPYQDENVFFAWHVADKHDLPFHKKELFVAYFTYDDEFKPQVWAQLKRFHDALCARKSVEQAGKVKQHALGWGCAEAKSWSCAGSSAGVIWEKLIKDLTVTHHGALATYDVRAIIRLDDANKGTASVWVENIRPRDATTGPVQDIYNHTRWSKIVFKTKVEVWDHFGDIWLNCHIREDSIIKFYRGSVLTETHKEGTSNISTLKAFLKDCPALAKKTIRPGDPKETVWKAKETSVPPKLEPLVVLLQGVSHTERHTVQAGAELILKTPIYPTAGYKDPPRLILPKSAAVRLAAEPRTESTGTGVRPGTMYIWRLAIAEQARGEYTIVVELRRSWESKASVRHTLLVNVQ